MLCLHSLPLLLLWPAAELLLWPCLLLRPVKLLLRAVKLLLPGYWLLCLWPCLLLRAVKLLLRAVKLLLPGYRLLCLWPKLLLGPVVSHTPVLYRGLLPVIVINGIVKTILPVSVAYGLPWLVIGRALVLPGLCRNILRPCRLLPVLLLWLLAVLLRLPVSIRLLWHITLLTLQPGVITGPYIGPVHLYTAAVYYCRTWPAALRIGIAFILVRVYLSTSLLSGPATNLVLRYTLTLFIMVVFLITVMFLPLSRQ